MLAAAYVCTRVGRMPVNDAERGRSEALCGALGHASVACVANDVVWIDGPRGIVGGAVGRARALVRGREAKHGARTPGETGAPSEENETFDLFMVGTRLSPEGHLLDVGDVHNLTRTSGADEALPIVNRSLAAYVVAIDDHPEAVHVLHLDGHDARAYDEMTRFQRFQIRVADWQQTGQGRGVERTVYALVPPPARAELTFLPDGTLEVKADARRLVIDAAQDTVVEGATHVRVTPDAVTAPPTFGPWMSDRLRAASWFGDEKNQILKVVAFTALEWLKGARAKVTGDTGEKDAQEDLAALRQDHVDAKPVAFEDPEIGWPPKFLDPPLKPPLAGEGQWVSLDNDPFITPIPGHATPFLTTFVRSDPAARQTRVYITLWDPRLVALHMEAGTVEPVSATGEAGPGQIPRAPEVIGRVVAGFNGGFQATHGQFGMQASGVLYLPPKPFAATVMELRDGTTAFGAWPPNAEVPDEVLSFRQNMTALVQNDTFNPWGRAWWGGVPPGWHDAIHTARSGLCLTKEKFVAYFWGNDIGPEPLGRAMLAARCAFGIHLDMNPGLVGFEFYNMQTAATFQPLGRPLQPDWEYEGGIKDLPDIKFRARRMIKSMGHMLFPRYIHRDARDFFYLTARPVLPGAPLAEEHQAATTTPGEGGNWRVKGLPQHGFPYAIATTAVKLGPELEAMVLRVDPRTVRAEPEGDAPANDSAESDRRGVVATFGHRGRAVADAGRQPSHLPDGAASGPRLWLGAHVFSIASSPPLEATAIADLTLPGAQGAAAARAAVGISDEDGMLQWIQLPEGPADANAADSLLKFLERLGCSSRALVAGDVRAHLGASLGLEGQPAIAMRSPVRLLRTSAPAARAYFESTEIVPLSVWSPLQQQKVKWRPTLAPPEKPAGGSPPATPPTSPN